MMDKGECTCESSPPGTIASDGIHCGYCGGHFNYGKSCSEHKWKPKHPNEDMP
jgi:hypothetical protein